MQNLLDRPHDATPGSTIRAEHVGDRYFAPIVHSLDVKSRGRHGTQTNSDRSAVGQAFSAVNCVEISHL